MNKLKINIDEVPNVLLLGNGINRAFNFASWKDLLNSIKTKEFSETELKAIDKVPNPLQPVILTGDNVGEKMKEISPELTLLKASSQEEILLKDFAVLPFDSILTTNYTYEMEKAITLEQRLLAESYNIEIKSNGLIDDNYKDYYHKVYEELKEKI